MGTQLETQLTYDPQHGDQAVVFNDTEVSTSEVTKAWAEQHPEMASLANWVNNNSSADGMFERDRFSNPVGFFEEVRAAQDAVDSDDVVSGVADTTEQIAFKRVMVECEDPQEQDVWRQILEDNMMETRMREIWREVFSHSNNYISTLWGRKSYKPEGSKKVFNLKVPMGISMMDPTKVIPVGSFMFNQEQLAYIGSRTEGKNFDLIMDPEETTHTDAIVQQLITGRYNPTRAEQKEIRDELGGGPIELSNLFLLDPKRTFRITATRPQYQRFASVRMKSIFELLDLKSKLRQMDRAHIVGAPLRVDQRLKTKDGWKAIGEVKVGEKIFGPDGKLTNITGVYPQGVLNDMFRVVFTDGAEVVCDGSHKWTVSTRSGQSRTISLNEILDEGLFDSNGTSARTHRHRIPMTSPVELEEKQLPVDPYLVGYLLGDGSIGGTIPAITTAIGEERSWESCLPEGVVWTQYEKRVNFAHRFALKGPKWRYNPLTDGLRELGIWGLIGDEKYIPEICMEGSVDQRLSLLQGLLDSDGSIAGVGSAEFSSCSKRMAEQVVLLSQSLGHAAKIYKKNEQRSNRKPHWRVYISVNGTMCPFRMKRKADKWQPRTRPFVRAIHSVTPVDPAVGVCIKVDRDDGLFLTEGYVVTHNTSFIILVTKGSDEHPAKPAEMGQLAAQVKVASRVPIIVSDHRLNIQIITPKLDKTLSPERYNALDARITARLYQLFSSGNYCVTPDTEIFTKSGWKTHDQLEVGELVYSANPETFKGEWTPVESVNTFDYEGEMLSMESRAHSSMSTPNHRWIVESKRGQDRKSDVRWKRSDELNLSDRIPVSSTLEAFPVEAKHTDELVELAAWFWCEGHRTVDAPNRVEIAQSFAANPEKCESIERALTKVFGPEGRVADGGVWYQSNDREQYYVSAAVTKPLLDLFEDNQPWGVKTEPKYPKLDFIYSLTKEQMELFVDTCVQGDGHREATGRRRWHQQNLKSVEIFETCLIMLGIPCRYRLDKSREDAGVWTVEFLKRKFARPFMTAYSANGRGADSATVEWVPYSGLVWCPTTKTGTWLARRNGKTFITGNSSGTANDDSLKLLRVVAASMEARRDKIREELFLHVIKPVFEENDSLKSTPKIVFYPRRISLGFDPNVATFLLDLRDSGEISRETILAELDILQSDEANKRRFESEHYDHLFPQPVQPGAPAPDNPEPPAGKDDPVVKPLVKKPSQKTAGRRGGGNSNKGGRNVDSTKSQPGRGPAKD